VRLLWSGEGLAILVQVLSGLLVARALGAGSYGELALVLAYGGLVYALVEPRAGEIVIKYAGSALAEGRPDDAWAVLRWTALLDAVVLAAAVSLTCGVRAAFPGVAPGSVLDVGLATAAAGCVGAVVTARAVLSVLDGYGAVARTQAGLSVARAVATASAALATQDVTLVVLAIASVAAVELALTCAVARTHLRGRHGRASGAPMPALRDAAPGAVRFLLYSEASTLLGSASKFADTLVVGAVAGTAEAGYYRLAASLTMPLGTLLAPLQTVAYNRFVKDAIQGGVAGLLRTARRLSLLTLPAAAGLAAAAPLVLLVVPALAGEEFSPAGPVALVLVLGTAVALPLHWLRQAYLVLGRLRAWLLVGTVTAAVSVGAFVLGATADGARGVALARVLTVVLLPSAVLALYLRRVTRSRP
jgi:O-antigen/teichoic acid export membrane protein